MPSQTYLIPRSVCRVLAMLRLVMDDVVHTVFRSCHKHLGGIVRLVSGGVMLWLRSEVKTVRALDAIVVAGFRRLRLELWMRLVYDKLKAAVALTKLTANGLAR